MNNFRPSRFEILPTGIKNLMIINGLFFLAQNTVGKQFNMEEVFALHTWQSPLFKPWQLVTHLFLHGSFSHILSNMFALWMFGSILENHWGMKRFFAFYISCGLGAALLHMGVLYVENQTMLHQFYAINSNSPAYYQQIETFINKYGNTSEGAIPTSIDYATAILNANLNSATLGASGAVFGCLAAFGYLFPNTKIYIYFLIPLKAKWFVILYAIMELSMAVSNSAGDNVAHVAHLGGALVGLVLVYYWNKNNRTNFY